LANADGGVIIYGIEEAEIGGSNVAVAFSPIVTAAVNRDWIGEVLRNGASPPLTRYDISEIVLPDGTGRVIVLEIQAATTAHQTLRDHRYFQRAGVVTSAMLDFQIKDLIARRSRPEVNVAIRTINMLTTADLHRYQFTATVENIGTVTIEKWWLEIDIPDRVVRDTRNGNVNLMSLQPQFSRYVKPIIKRNLAFKRVAFGDPTSDGSPQILHPGQSMKFDGEYPQVLIEIDHQIWGQLQQTAPPLEWKIYLPNAQPVEGVALFEDWCRF